MAVDHYKLRSAVAATCHNANRDLNQLLDEMDFVEALCELHPRQAQEWRRLMKKAAELIKTRTSGSDLAKVSPAVRDAEKLLAPIGKAAKTYTVHCVGHAHIDMNWMWWWPETVAITVDTISTVLKLMEEFPAFTFSQSQASIYKILEEHAPEMLEKIKRRVKEGRWEVTASHWVEGDKNMAGGEALTRHLLYTRRYMKELFGLKPEDVPIDWSPDTFGHAITMPSYLARGGVKYLYMHRPGVFTNPKPMAFKWKGPDGSTILTKNDMDVGYNCAITPELGRQMVKFAKATGAHVNMIVYGVGDHGGGPTRVDILNGLDMDTWPIFPNVKFSTAKAFFEALEKESRKLPVVTTELNTEFAGCYTTQSLIKRANRLSECRMSDAEASASLAWGAIGFQYPEEKLREGWRNTLFSHFHDILPGSGKHDTRTFTHGLFQKTIALTNMVESNALRLLAAKVDTSRAAGAGPSEKAAGFTANALGAGVGFGIREGKLSQYDASAGAGNRPFLVFNPTDHDREEVVEATVWDNSRSGAAKGLRERSFAVQLPDGKIISSQKTASGGYWFHQYATVAFPVKVPAMGYALCTVLEDSAPQGGGAARQLGEKQHNNYAPYDKPHEGLENGLVRLDLDPATGGIRRLLDKKSGVAIIDAANPEAVIEYMIERPQSMTSWSMAHGAPGPKPRLATVRRPLEGPYKASIDFVYRIAESDMTVTFELRAGDPRVYVRIAGTWFQRGTSDTGVPVLRLALPLALKNAAGRYEVPFGAIDRNLNEGDELPALQWAQASGTCRGKKAGCLLVNDCKHGYSLDGNTLRLTLIRSAYEPDTLPEIGQHEINLALRSFTGDMQVADAVRLGNDLNHPLRVVGTDAHKGKLPIEAGMLSIKPDSVVMTGFKKAEDSDTFIIRLFEAAGRKCKASIRFNSKLLGKVVSAAEVDLIERPMRNSSAKVAGDTVSVNVPARGIVSVMVKTKRL